MYKRIRVKKLPKRKIKLINVFVAISSILVSLAIVNVCGSFQQSHINSSVHLSLEQSAIRLANAFEIYNDKRFLN